MKEKLKGMKKWELELESIEDAITKTHCKLSRLEDKKDSIMREHICAEKGHDDRNTRTGFWECRNCGRVLVTL